MMDNRDYGDEQPEEECRWGQSPLMTILREHAWLHIMRKQQMRLYEYYFGPIKEEDVELRFFINKQGKSMEKHRVFPRSANEPAPSLLAAMVVMQEVIAAQIYNNRSEWVGEHPNTELGTRSITAEEVLPYVRDRYLALEKKYLRAVCEEIRDTIILNRVSRRVDT